jgi:hypothetical protein
LVAGVVLGLIASAAPPSAEAQTRLAVLGGGIIPFEDGLDPSFRGGVRAEFQPVDALGRHRRLAWYVAANYADVASEAESGGSSTLIDAGLGMRVYSGGGPLFLEAGAGYTNWSADGADSQSGIDLQGGGGLAIPAGSANFELEATFHTARFDGSGLEYLSLLAGLAFPF